MSKDCRVDDDQAVDEAVEAIQMRKSPLDAVVKILQEITKWKLVNLGHSEPYKWCHDIKHNDSRQNDI